MRTMPLSKHLFTTLRNVRSWSLGVRIRTSRSTPNNMKRTSTREHIIKIKYLDQVVTSDLRDDDKLDRELRALPVRASMIDRRFARCRKIFDLIFN